MNSQNIVGSRWITECDPDLRITELMIPGTHDSATSTCYERYYRTQDLSLAEQLDCGVRFLDIRLRREMVAAHREWISDISAEEIFEKCGEFLQKNPQEFVLMRIQNANEQKDDFPEYAEALLSKVQQYKSLFYAWDKSQIAQDGNPIWPRIAQTAGKIIPIECAPPNMLVNKINGELWAANWHENTQILLQDLWNGPTLEEKSLAIKSLVEQSGIVDLDKLLLNHISATNGELQYPDAYAEQLNKYASQLWQQLARRSFRGVQIYDFINPSICQELLRLNFA
ncbi:hypothetical protein JFL47_02395 [Haemophilus haemoglobinophilus]|nr:hypothetical protein [Canicola haemoglobinophilus]